MADKSTTQRPDPVTPDPATPSPATRTADTSDSYAQPSDDIGPYAPLQYRDRNRYAMRGEQGRGGLGLVLRAHDRELQRDVAVKELQQRDGIAEWRFLREALVTSRLEHPGIVPVHEAGRWPDGTPFYTMKLVGGRSLKQRLEDHPTLEGRLAFVPNLIAVADAVAYAHDRRIIHRDLKPSNIMVGDFGETIVIDWGLAKSIDDASDPLPTGAPNHPLTDALTVVGAALGTPAYMPPEQHRGQADHRSDIYALGGALYHLLSRNPPHDDKSQIGVPSAANLTFPRDAPADLIAIVRRAMAPDPANRYQSVREFADDLRRFGRRDPVKARRYSPLARLSLAFARRRAIALVIMAALVALSVVLTISVLNIARERTSALAAHRNSVIANASALLERNPTQAWRVLNTAPIHSETAFLRARIHAAGVAERTVRIPDRFQGQHILDDGHRVVVVLGDRSIRVVDSRTGILTHLADGLTEPARWTASNEYVYFVTRTSHLSIASVAINGGPVNEVSRIDSFPVTMNANEAGVFWQTADGKLFQASREGKSRALTQGLSRFMLIDSKLALCTKNGILSIKDLTTEQIVHGICDPQGDFNWWTHGFVHLTRDKDLWIYFRNKLRRIASTDLFKGQVMISSAGLVAGISESGHGVYWRPDSDSAIRVSLPSPARTVDCRASSVAWALQDGTLRVIDTSNGHDWSLQAQPEVSWCLGVLDEQRAMTCSRNEIRFWKLAPTAASLSIPLPAQPISISFSRTHDILFDTFEGDVYIFRTRDSQVVLAHHHVSNLQSQGVAWCNDKACSASVDGRVQCTEPHNNSSTTILQSDSSAVRLTGNSGRCYAATESGEIYDVESHSILYRHPKEPYRIATTNDGHLLATADMAGNVITYDTIQRRVIASRLEIHRGPVTGIAWLGNVLVTSGVDGRLHVMASDMRQLQTRHFSSAIRHLVAAEGTIALALDSGAIWMISASNNWQHHVDTSTHVSSLAVSSDGSAIAGGVLQGEVVVIAADGRVASSRFGGRVTCLAFSNNNDLLVCAPSGKLMRLPLSSLNFQIPN